MGNVCEEPKQYNAQTSAGLRPSVANEGPRTSVIDSLINQTDAIKELDALSRVMGERLSMVLTPESLGNETPKDTAEPYSIVSKINANTRDIRKVFRILNSYLERLEI